ncbi:MAG: CHAT domain-containing protein [Microcoleus sp. SIO2G3]|nr:CHAT domain-containing protein [Microcoleus sp. SIO2G3]
MKVIIFEICRSPEIQKETEALILSNFFTQQGIDYKVYSNDAIWSERTVLDKDFMGRCLRNHDVGIVHLAMHGNNNGFVLRWSDAENIRYRVAEDLLTSFEIGMMSGWKGKMLVSGACSSAKLASSFLEAGATDVIAPETPIPWRNLGSFFKLFYQALFLGQNAISALALAISQFPEFKSYQVYSTNSRDRCC